MTNENNNRLDGQNDQKIQSPEFVKEQIKNSGSYKLIPVKGKSRMPVRKLSLQQEKQLVAYCEALNKCIFTAMGPPRTACKAKLEVNAFGSYKL